MTKNTGKWCRVLWAVLLIVGLLLTGCAHTPNEPDPTKPADTESTELPEDTQSTELPEDPESTQDTEPAQETEEPAAASPVSPQELAGTWELAWTEVEGDRNEAAPGVCIIEITPDETGFFRFTYSNRDFPEENIQDRELLVVPGELYPGCGNDQWIAEVSEESGDTLQYALTLLEDGTLLLQTCWEMDGMPWVSYGWYERID